MDGLAPASIVATERPADTGILLTTAVPRDGGRGLLGWLSAREPVIRRVVLCAVLYSMPLVALSKPVLDPDIWWHLRTGQWVVQHGCVPTTDPFSTFGDGRRG